MHRPALVTFAVIALGVAASRATADPLVAVFAGGLCDRPQVRDRVTFPASCQLRPALGGDVGWRLGRWQAELDVVYGQHRYTSPGFVTDAAIRVDVLDLAPVVSWRLTPRPDRLALVLRFGPQVGSRLRARRRFRDADQDITGHLHETELKVLGGVRVARTSGRGSWFIDGRVGWGLTDLDDTGLHEIRTRTFVAGFGYER